MLIMTPNNIWQFFIKHIRKREENYGIRGLGIPLMREEKEQKGKKLEKGMQQRHRK